MKKLCYRLNQLKNAFANRAPSFTRTLGYSDIIYNSSEINPKNKDDSYKGLVYTSKNPFLLEILSVLKREGYIRFYTVEPKGRSINVTVYLKYTAQGCPGIRSIFPISTPGRILYASNNSLWQPLNTSGIIILTTPRGILTDSEARKYCVGGQLLFGVA